MSRVATSGEGVRQRAAVDELELAAKRDAVGEGSVVISEVWDYLQARRSDTN